MLLRILAVGILLMAVRPVRNEDVVSVDNSPPYVKKCYEGDPKVIECFISALEHLQPYLAAGIKEIELPSVEPFLMDELSLSLTGGPNGYTISLKEMMIYGASNFSMSKLKLSENGKPFEAKINIPSLRIMARYQSSGVLIILPASGNGTFLGHFGEFSQVFHKTYNKRNKILDNLDCMLKGRASVNGKADGQKYLHVDSLHVDLTVKKMRMMVKNIFKNNPILTEAINLFLREHGHEIFKVMLPQLRKKLATLFMDISNKLLAHVPLDVFYVPLVKQIN